LKTAWLTSGAPVEVPLALGIIPQYPENYGALCGARKVGTALCQVAESAGYSPDLCSYARAGIGSVLEPPGAPLGGLGRPDVLIACNNICGTVTKWWEHLAHYLGVPLFLLDTPFTEGDRPDHLIRYATRQVEALIAFLERHTGRRYRERRFKRVADRSRETVRLWNECLDLCTARPAPLGAADRFVTMAPVVALRGTWPALWFYRTLKREVVNRAERGVGAIREERKRLLWDNIAIWYDIYGLFNRFAERGAAFPVDTYTSAWTGTLPRGAPAEAVARVYSDIYLNRGMASKVDVMTRMIQRYELDGFVLHSNRSCKPYSLGQNVIRQELTERTGKPGLVIDADMVDSRHYDEKRVASGIATFVEMLS
jgi:benzoyl-CoA reductase/2-hydroxyglutaryl-CoA dehydratase subunit BcrC/BadD/HgdB